MSKYYWTERTIPDTKLGRKLYKNQIVRIDSKGITIKERHDEVGTFTAPSSGTYEFNCKILIESSDGSSSTHTLEAKVLKILQGETTFWPNGWAVPSNHRKSYITDYSVRKVY